MDNYIIRWSQGLCTGDDYIDSQHRRFVELVVGVSEHAASRYGHMLSEVLSYARMDVTCPRILIAEGKEAHVEAIRRALERVGTDAEPDVTGTLRGYCERAASTAPDIALVNLSLPDGRAFEVLTSPPEAGQFPVVVMTSCGRNRQYRRLCCPKYKRHMPKVVPRPLSGEGINAD